MEKKLKLNGCDIDHYQVNVVSHPVESEKSHEKLFLEVVAGGIHYAYDIHRDTRHPDIATIKSHLESSLAQAIEDKLNVEVSEYTERNYIFIKFQGIEQAQYTGRRTT